MSFSFGQMARITDHLYLGGAMCVLPEKIRQTGITCIINCTNEIPTLPLMYVENMRVGLDDVPSAKIITHFDRVADKIRSVRDKGGVALVHCAAGVSRSASMCIAYLMKYYRMTLKEAYNHVKNCRPVIRPNCGFFRQLIDYENRLFGRTTVSMVTSPIGFIPDVYKNDMANMVMLNPSPPPPPPPPARTLSDRLRTGFHF